MKLGKEKTDGALDIVEAFAQEEIEKLKGDGYELIAETDKPSDNATCCYERVENGWVQVWEDLPSEKIEEIDI